MTAPAIVLRDRRMSDEPILRDAWCAAWSALFPAIDFRERWPAMMALWDDILAVGGRFIVAEHDGRPVGFLVVTAGGEDMLLEQLLVAPGHDGRGIGQRLLIEAKRLARRRLRLSVNADNIRAVALYERQGFVKTDERINTSSGLPVFDYVWTRAAAAQVAIASETDRNNS